MQTSKFKLRESLSQRAHLTATQNRVKYNNNSHKIGRELLTAQNVNKLQNVSIHEVQISIYLAYSVLLCVNRFHGLK